LGVSAGTLVDCYCLDRAVRGWCFASVVARAISEFTVNSQGQSCPLCGQVEEPDSMVMVRLPYPRVPSHDTALLCRFCVSAIAGRATELQGEPDAHVDQRVAENEPDPKPTRKPRRITIREIAKADTSDPSAA
jgi:hypothetical protein